MEIGVEAGEGEEGEIAAREPWNKGNGWKVVEVPALNGMPSRLKARVWGRQALK
jgi:hypothetical protein